MDLACFGSAEGYPKPQAQHVSSLEADAACLAQVQPVERLSPIALASPLQVLCRGRGVASLVPQQPQVWMGRSIAGIERQ